MPTTPTETQLVTIAAGLLGGAVGYFLGGQRIVWTAVGALVGAVVVPPVASAAAANALPEAAPETHDITLVPSRTIILRTRVGDTVIVHAPSGWGVPSMNANVPGFLQIESTDTAAETMTLTVTEGGQGQIQLQNGDEVAVLSVTT